MLIYKLLFWTYPTVLNIDMSSYQEVGIKFHCVQMCPHFRGLE